MGDEIARYPLGRFVVLEDMGPAGMTVLYPESDDPDTVYHIRTVRAHPRWTLITRRGAPNPEPEEYGYG